MLAEDVSSMKVAFAPGFFRTLGKLPVVEARAKAAGYRLWMFGSLVVTEAIIRQTQGIGQHPAFAIVLGEKSFDASFGIAAHRFDLGFEIPKGDQGQHRAPLFRVFVLINTPKPVCVPRWLRKIAIDKSMFPSCPDLNQRHRQ